MPASILDPRMIDQLKPLAVTNTSFANITSVVITTPGGTSNDWTQTYEIVQSLSSDWNSTFNTVQGLSSTWEETLLIAELSATNFDLLTSIEDLYDQTVFLGNPHYFYAETEDDSIRGIYKRQNYTLPLSDSFYYEKFTGLSASNIFTYFNTDSAVWVFSDSTETSATGQTIYATNSTTSIADIPLTYWNPITDIRLQVSDRGETLPLVVDSLSASNVQASSLSLSAVTFTNRFTVATSLTATTTVLEVIVDGVPKYIRLFDVN